MSNVINHPNGSIEYLDDNGNCHRDNGPAFVWLDGSEMWFRHGQEHRADGPSSINYHVTYYENGEIQETTIGEYWAINGKNITRKVRDLMSSGDINPNWREWTDADKILFRLRF